MRSPTGVWVVLVLAATTLRGAVTDEWTVAPDRLESTVHELRASLEAALFRDGSREALPQRVPATVLRCGPDTYEVTWLYEAVRDGRREDLVAAWDRLRSWEDTLGPPPVVDAARVKALATEILSDEAYQPVDTSSWIDPWLPYIERLFDILFAPLLHRSADSSPLRDVLAALVYVLAVGLLAALVVRAVRHRRSPVAEATPAAQTAAAKPDRRAAEWRRMAKQAGTKGERELALGLLYVSLLVRLDETGRMPFDPSRTNWDNVAAAGLDEPLAAGLRELAQAVDTVAYGGRPCRAEELARCEAVVDRLWSVE